MKNITILSILLSAAFIVLFSFRAKTNSAGKANPTSGSPASNNNSCTQCHSGATISDQTVDIVTNIPPDGFDPNTQYTISVVAKKNTSNSAKVGFNLTVEDQNGHVGTLTPGTGNETQLINNAMTHRSSSNTFMNGERTWQFFWNSGNAQNSTIYVACLFANGNGTNNGDATLLSSLPISRNTIGINEFALTEMNFYPNPVVDRLQLNGNISSTGDLKISIVNTAGQKMFVKNFNLSKKGNFSESLDLSNLTNGNYVLLLEMNGKQSTHSIIKS